MSVSNMLRLAADNYDIHPDVVRLVEALIAAEREACAKIADSIAEMAERVEGAPAGTVEQQTLIGETMKRCGQLTAHKIRARKDPPDA